MSSYETRTMTDADGRVLIKVPPGLAGQDVRVTVESTTPATVNGTADNPSLKAQPIVRPSRDERRRLLDIAMGAIDDPTLVRPPQGEYEVRESLD